MPHLAHLIRQRREALGLSLAALASAVGATKGYLSMIENQRLSNPPSRGLLAALEQALGLHEGELVRQAEWQNTPATVKAAFAQVAAKADRGQALARLLRSAATDPQTGGRDLDALYHSGELTRQLDALLPPPEVVTARGGEQTGALPGAGAGAGAGEFPGAAAAIPGAGENLLPGWVPLINRVAAGPAVEHTDLDFPSGTAEDMLPAPALPAELFDAAAWSDAAASPVEAGLGPRDSFATRIIGDSMQPQYQPGDIILCSAAAKVESGCDCFVRLEPDHQSTFKRVYFDEAGDTVRLQPLNPAHLPRIVPREDIAALYRAVWKYSRV